MLNPVFAVHLERKWRNKTVCSDASRKSLGQAVDELLKGAGSSEGAGQDMTNEIVSVFYKVLPCCINPTATPPLCQLVWTVNQLSFGSWSIFPLGLVQVCESIWKLCTFLQ